ncbi:phage tail family protein [Paenibacillus sp. J5C_2022]|uniref:distal tail protein Dit n=1 Tax=Paenibacillus sp. J5C2022 TaxID=2977129 RepID=UPI0021D2167B|nr:distal tail protein Dit [Paenibacillus sp. J5C2022]MCU6709360.1 phage tail family protein [Paenibacillus sp. J5C2022]
MITGTYGFTFKGRHSSEFGVRLLRYTVNSPDLREYEDEPAGLPGVIDYGTELGKRELEMTVDIEPNGAEFKRRQSEILTWLKPTTAAGIIVFDDVPDRFFYAKLSGRLTAEQIGRYGEFRVTMKCTDPFAYGPERIYEGTITGNPEDIVLESYGSEPTPPIVEMSNAGGNVIGEFTLQIEFETE